MRVYGALMWSLGKVVKTPEVLRVYIGSFWDREYQIKENKSLFEAEQNDLLADLRSLPRNSSVRKVNELVKRARCAKVRRNLYYMRMLRECASLRVRVCTTSDRALICDGVVLAACGFLSPTQPARRAQVHAHIISHMYDQFGFFSKQSTQDEMLAKLPDIFLAVHQKTGLPIGDFPNPQRFKESIQHMKIWEFPELKPKHIASMDDVLANDIPTLLKMLPTQHEESKSGGSALNPFDDVNAGVGLSWSVTSPDKTRFDNIFFSLPLDGDKVKGQDAKTVFLSTGVSVEVLKKVWALADISKRGLLDSEEFAVAMHLIEALRDGRMAELPARLPAALVPPSKRHLVPHALHS